MRNFGMKYGAVLGIILVGFALLFFLLQIDSGTSILPSIVNNLVIIGFLIFSILKYRNTENEGFISYGESLKLGTTITFFSSIILAFYSYLYIYYLHPEASNEILNAAQDAMLENNPDISDKDLDLALQMMRNFLQPHWIMISGILGGTFMGFLYSLIISVFVRKNNPENLSI